MKQMKKIILFFFIIYTSLGLCFADISYQNKIDTFLDSYSSNAKILSTLKDDLAEKLTHKKEYTSQQLEIITYFKDQTENKIQIIRKNEVYIPTQQTVNALYYSAYAASLTTKIDDIIDISKNTDVNAIVIDIKEIDGKTSFAFSDEDF
jgi:hypothetical protein